MELVKSEVRFFITKFFGKENFNDSDNLSELGFVNSLFAMQLIMFVEKKFDIRIENEEMDFKNFNSVEAIANLVNNKIQNSIVK
ncbi:acyl carrier protein [Bacillus cereus group sp. MYBK108-2]|uniref:acyl carrier protein n=1 Tax=unclassified Bacillus cereus group TaxID=2750818 RepID=UPI00288DD081|nr:acyl carrier protein [Bacillus cereus]MDA2307629.1 acyl carrier protein [Bacillus cereus]HDX9634238.1 acyl carrier protein [Bacillus cereus]HEF1897125.1 acyl carrier protein [Bacillus cereus]